MPETLTAEVVIKNAKALKTKKGKDWWAADDGVRSFTTDLTPYEGQTVTIDYTADQYNGEPQKIVSAVKVNPDVPKLGTGDYKRAAPSNDERRATNTRTALMQAVASLNHTINKDMTPKDVAQRVLPLASAYSLWLIQNQGDEPSEKDVEDGIPF